MKEARDPQYSERLDQGLAFVAAAFRCQVRTGSGVPYIAHLLQVAATVAEHGGDEDRVVAALCHDDLEDIDGARPEELAACCSRRVADYVVALSDSTTHPKPPWFDRKRAYLARLRDELEAVKLISAADKLHNASAIVRDRRRVDERVWERFTPTREQTLWYYHEVVASLGTRWEHPLLDELRRVVDAMHASGEDDSP